MLKSIPTSYGGVSFRSRTEARWAVFFDVLGIPWEYEAEGFERDGIRYLPDFFLTLNHGRKRVYFEVKGGPLTESEIEKLCVFSWTTGEDDPDAMPPDDHPFLFVAVGSPQHVLGYNSGGVEVYSPHWDVDYRFCSCPRCHALDLQFEGRSDRIGCGCPKSAHGDKGMNDSEPLVEKAIEAATSASFWTPTK